MRLFATTKIKLFLHKSRKGLLVGMLAFLLALVSTQPSAALTSSSLSLSDSRISQTSQYTFSSTDFSTGQTIGCIEIDLGTAADATGAISGLSTASSTFVSQTITATGTWTVDNTQSASHKLRLTNATPVAPQSGAQTVVWGAVTNGNTAETSYFAKFTTYTTNSCATPSDTITVKIIYTNGQLVSLSVDPSLSFTVTGTSSGTSCNGTASNVTTTTTTVPLGTVTTGANGVGVQNLTVTTNAGSGYTVHARYLAAPTNGVHNFIDHTGTNAAPSAFPAAGATEAYGYTTNDAVLGTGTAARFTGGNWAKFTTSNLEVAYSNAAVASEVTCFGYQAGIVGTTPAGSYTSTTIFTATPLY